MKYYCNCCGTDFTEEQGKRFSESETEVACPNCGATRLIDDDDDSIIEQYNG